MTGQPAAKLFPPMSEEENQQLADDVRENGLHHPIVRFQGQVLDGRNRLRACEIAGVPPLFEEWEGTSPVGYVLSENLVRRHLTPGQKAMIADDARALFEAEARDRQGTRTDLSPDLEESSEPVENRGPGRADRWRDQVVCLRRSSSETRSPRASGRST